MAPISGLLGSVVYMTAGTVNAVGINEWSLDFSMDTPDTSSWSSGAWNTFLNGVQSYTFSFSGPGDTDSSMATWRNAALGGSAIAARLYTGTATYFNVGTAYITGMSPAISRDGILTNSFDCQGSGPLTYV